MEFREGIREATGWDVRMLSKEEEGRIGALGVASSLADVQGLMMDLGGGSCQITWMDCGKGDLEMSRKGAMSFPYGAAALTRRLEEVKRQGGGALKELEREMVGNFQRAFDELGVPEDMLERARAMGGMDIYLSGGGFRGWGYLLMNQSTINPYPIPIINGFSANRSNFQDTMAISNVVATTSTKDIFRISERRASQVPAVAFLIKNLTKAIPAIKTIHFCQGGVREGFLFQTLPPQIRSEHPLVVATSPYATPSTSQITALLTSCFPTSSEDGPDEFNPPSSFSHSFLTALTNLLYAHSSLPKDIRPAAALHSTVTGLLASAHGLSHHYRTLLALTLYARWSGDLSPPDQALLTRMRQLVSIKEAWWAEYLGTVASVVGDVYPAGLVPEEGGQERITFQADRLFNQKNDLALQIKVEEGGFPDDRTGWFETLESPRKRIEKVGKKKNWIRDAAGRGFGLRIAVICTEREE